MIYILDILAGLFLGLVSVLMIGVLIGTLIEKYYNTEKKKLQWVARKIAQRDADPTEDMNQTVEGKIREVLSRKPTVADLEYVNSFYPRYIEEEEKRYNEKMKQKKYFCQAVNEHRNRVKKELDL